MTTIQECIDQVHRAGACDQPDLFFPRNEAEELAAAQFCNESCSVVKQCLAIALVQNERDGVWGATTSKERKKILNSKPRRLLMLKSLGIEP